MTNASFMIRTLSILISLWCVLWPIAGSTQEAAAKSTNPVILVVGDSLSAEYGIRRGSGWVQWLSENKKEALGDARLVNASISGDTTAGGRTRLPALLQKNKPAITILELGANDALRGLSLEASRDNLQWIIAAAKKAGSQVILVGMQIPPNFGPVYAKQFKALFADLAAQEETALVPFLFESFALDRQMYQDDGIHPAEAAQPLMAETVWAVLEKVLTEYRRR